MSTGTALRLPPNSNTGFQQQSRKTRQFSASYVQATPQRASLPANRPSQQYLHNFPTPETNFRAETSKNARQQWLQRIHEQAQTLQDQADSLQSLCDEARELRTHEEQIQRQELIEAQQTLITQRYEEAAEKHRIERAILETEKQTRVLERQRQVQEAKQRWAELQERARIRELEAREARRIEIEEAERRHREEMEVRRLQQEEEERRRRERLRECVACFDSHDLSMMIELPCTHWYCREDLEEAFSAALEGTPSEPFQCCGQVAHLTLHPRPTPEFQRRYATMLLERSTPNPAYCSNRACGVFIPPANYNGPDLANCISCGYTTCRLCRNPAHGNGICPEDEGVRQVETLAVQQGWMRCVNCREMVEKSVGCNHMTCRCGSQWCYVCLSQNWRECGH